MSVHHDLKRYSGSWPVMLSLFVASLASGNALIPHEAIEALKAGAPAGADLTQAAVVAARKLGYVQSHDVASTYVVPKGYDRLMGFQAIECHQIAEYVCPKDPSQVPQSLIFIERQRQGKAVVIRVVQWCLKSCDGRVKATAKLLAEEIENTKVQRH